MSEETNLPLSALNQYAYCPRRCFLIHAEGEFTDNVHTLQGSREHERVDQNTYECKQDVRAEFALPVWSDSLGLSGRCDVVEFRPDGSVYPVEYKHGKRRQWLNDDLQLAAQALCLEEMTGKRIERGAVFHEQSKRRREVVIDAQLRAAVAQTAAAVHNMLDAGRCPPPVAEEKRCGECSLKKICQPEMIRAVQAGCELAERLFDAEDEVF
ncbi:MAG: CRISPR-associated protein Cas4 [Gammaproteobacteria bacterium]